MTSQIARWKHTTDNPLISVVIPAFNGERHLRQSIESVFAQDHRPIELIVVDDGSTDHTAQVAQAFPPPLHYYVQPHRGAATARNRGAELAHGDFLAFLDADDLWTSHKLSAQLHAFRAQPELDILFGHVQQFISPELDESAKARLHCPTDPLPGPVVGTMLLRLDTFRRIGPFAEHLHTAEFLDWYARAREMRLSVLMLAEVVMLRRIHRSNQGVLHRERRVEYPRVLKAMLDRRRADASTTSK